MKREKVLLIVAIAALLAVGFFFWHSAHPPAHKRLIAKKYVVTAPTAKKKAVAPVLLPSGPKKFTNPRVAVVMDDFGYNKNNLDMLFNTQMPVTLSILPDLKYSSEIARLAELHGYEVILHLPLEPYRKDVKEEYDTIKSGMKESDIDARLAREIASVPGLKGVSNHMGSKSTEDKQLMSVIFKYLKTNNLYFFDSLTSQKSVCRECAAVSGIPCERRDIFLDNSEDVAAIEKQVMILKKMAFKRGKVIAVCHDKKNTIEVLARMMPGMAKEGVKFVYLSELVNIPATPVIDTQRSRRVR